MFIVIFWLISSIGIVLSIGGGGVLNDLYFALEEIENLEKNNLSYENISVVTKRELEIFHDVSELKRYIRDTEKNLLLVQNCVGVFIILLVLSFILRIYLTRVLIAKHALNAEK